MASKNRSGVFSRCLFVLVLLWLTTSSSLHLENIWRFIGTKKIELPAAEKEKETTAAVATNSKLGEMKRRTLLNQRFTEDYQGIEIALPDSIRTEQLSMIGVPEGIVVTISASDLMLSEINWDSFSLRFNASINFQHEQQQLDRTFYINGFNSSITLDKPLDSAFYDKFVSGTLLSPENIFPCILRDSFDNPDISVALGHIFHAYDNNNISPQKAARVESIETLSVDLFASIQGLRIVSATSVRRLVHEVVDSYIITSRCPDMIGGHFYLDWRDFFLSPQKSLDLGGTGLKPYGNVGQNIFSLLNKPVGINPFVGIATDWYHEEEGLILIQGHCNIFSVEFDPTSMLGTDIETFAQQIVNRRNIENATLEPVDSNGLLVNVIVASILNVVNVSRVKLGIQEVRISNLDTFNKPSKIFYPTNQSFTLENVWNIGTTANNTRPVTVAIRNVFELDGNYFGPRTVNTQFDISLAADLVEVQSEVFALVPSEQLLLFPLEDFANVNCWLALGTGLSHGGEPALKFNSLNVSATNVSLNVTFNNTRSSTANIFNVNSVISTLANRLLGYINEWVFHDSFQTFLNVIFNMTSFFCPHMQDYNTSLQCNPTQDDSLAGLIYAFSDGTPYLSEEADQTLIFTGLLITQMTLLSLAEIFYAGRDENSTSSKSKPLSEEEFIEPLDLPDEAVLVNWKDLSSPILSWLLGAFRLHFVSEGPEPKDVDLNIWMEEFFLEDGELVLDFESGLLRALATSMEILNTEISISSVHITGLNRFTYVDVLNPVTPHRFDNAIRMNKLELQFDVKLKNPNIDEEIKIKASFDGFNASMPIFLALDLIDFESLQVGSFLFSGNIFWCLLTAVHGIHFPNISVEVGEILDFSVRGAADDIDEAMADSLDSMLDLMRPQIDHMIDHILEVFLREVLNQFFENAMKISFCPAPREVNFGFVDFREMLPSKKSSISTGTNLWTNTSVTPQSKYSIDYYGDLFRIIKILCDRTLFSSIHEAIKEPMINHNLVRPATTIQSGEAGKLVLPVDIAEVELSGLWIMKEADLLIHLYNLTIDNADTFGLPMTVMDPNERHGELLDFKGSIGVRGRPFKFSFLTLLSMFNFRNLMRLDFEFYDVKWLLALYARVRYRELVQLRMENSLDPDCWALLFTTWGGPVVDPGFELDHFELSFEKVGFNVTCVECSSGGLEFPNLITRLNKTVDVVFRRLANFSVSLLDGFINTGMMDTYVLSAAYNCASEVGLPPLSYQVEVFPPLTVDSLETVAFLIYLGAQLTIDFLLDQNADADLESFPNPLKGQNKLPTEINFVDFTETESFNPLYPLIYMNDFLRAPVGHNRTKANLAAEHLLSDGNFDIPYDQSFGAETWTVKISDMRLTGLNTLTNFNMLKHPGPQVIQSEYGWKKFALEFVVHATSNSANATDTEEEETFEFKASLSFEDFSVSTAFLVALDKDKLVGMKIGDLLEADDAIPCLFEIAYSLVVTEFYVTASSLFFLDVDGYRSREIIEAIEEFNTVLGDRYSENLNVSLPALTDSTVRSILNAIIDDYLSSAPACGAVGNSSIALFEKAVKEGYVQLSSYDEDTVDLRDLFLSDSSARYYGGTGLTPYGQWFYYMKTLIDMALGVDDDEGPSVLNDILFSGMGVFSALQSHYESPKVLDIDQALHFRYNVRFTAGIFDFKIENLDTIGGPMEMLTLTPDSPYSFNNTITFGAHRKPLLISFRVKFGLEIGGNSTSNELLFSASIYSLSLVADMFLKLSKKRLIDFPIVDVFNLFCWVSTLPAPSSDSNAGSHQQRFGFHRLVASAEKIKLNVTCVECNERVRDMLEQFNLDETTNISTWALNNVLDGTLRSLAIPYAQEAVNEFLHYAAQKCPHRDEVYTRPNNAKGDSTEQSQKFYISDGPMNTNLYGFLSMVTSILSVFAIFSICVWYSVHKRNNEWFDDLPTKHYKFPIEQRHKLTEKLEIDLNKETRCMFHCGNEIPLFVRYTFPVVLLCSVVLFIFSHSREGSMLGLDLSLFGDNFAVEDTFTPPMFQFFTFLWKRGPKKIALPIFLSITFPYAKQFTTLAVWFIPPTYISTSLRRSILYWLSAFAKWSIFDVMFFIVSAVGLNFSVPNVNFEAFGPDFYIFRLSIRPTWGLYANLAAQMISQISSHVALHYHDKIVETSTRKVRERHNRDLRPYAATRTWIFRLTMDLDDLYGDEKETLRTYGFTRLYRDESEILVTRGSVNVLLVYLAIFLAAFVFWAFYDPVVSFETVGVLNATKNLGIDMFPKDTYSVHTMCTSLWEDAVFLGKTRDFVGLAALIILLYFTLLMIPFALVAVLAYQWFVPITGKRRRMLLGLTEILQTHNYCEVFLFAIVILAWQLEDWSNTVLDELCSGFSPQLAYLQRIGFISQENSNSKCFGRILSIDLGAYVMVISIALLHLLQMYVVQAAKQYFEKIEEWDLRGSQHLWTETESETANDPPYMPFLPYPNVEPLKVYLSWDLVHNADQYILSRSSGQNIWTTIATLNSTPSPGYTDIEVIPGTTYYYRLQARNDAGDSQWSSVCAIVPDKVPKRHIPFPIMFTDRFRWTLHSPISSWDLYLEGEQLCNDDNIGRICQEIYYGQSSENGTSEGDTGVDRLHIDAQDGG